MKASGHVFKTPPVWGKRLSTEHEQWLSGRYCAGRPVFVMNFPVTAASFYARRNDVDSPHGPTAATFDLLTSAGELIGGGQREDRYDLLLEKMVRVGVCGVWEGRGMKERRATVKGEGEWRSQGTWGRLTKQRMIGFACTEANGCLGGRVQVVSGPAPVWQRAACGLGSGLRATAAGADGHRKHSRCDAGTARAGHLSYVSPHRRCMRGCLGVVAAPLGTRV